MRGVSHLRRGSIMNIFIRASLRASLVFVTIAMRFGGDGERLVGDASPIGGRETSRIQPDWPRPEPLDSVLLRDGLPDCGVAGAGGDSITNLRKNRVDVPLIYHVVPFATIATLAYPINHRGSRSPDRAAHNPGWSREDLAAVARYEGVALSVTGFVARPRGVIVQSSKSGSKGESTNCHALDDSSVDWHITLVPNPGDPKSAGIVVETTPRIRRTQAFAWTPSMLDGAAAAGDSVRISGWLMYDPEHFAQTADYDPARPVATILSPAVRSALWEIHPVTEDPRSSIRRPVRGSWFRGGR